jgi:hypothetical protein
MSRSTRLALFPYPFVVALAVMLLIGGPVTITSARGAVAERNLVANPSFEGHSFGWSGWNAVISRREIGTVPHVRHFLRVARRRGVSYGVVDRPDTVRASVAGARYTASAWVRLGRSRTRGKKLYLTLREISPSGSLIRRKSSSVRLTGSFRRVTVSVTAAGVDNRLGMSFVQRRAAPGDVFFLDVVRLVRQLPADSPLPAPNSPPAALPAKGFGFSLPDIGSPTAQPERERILDTIKAAGGTWVRFDMWWGSIERSRGQWTWGDFDRLIDSINRRGLRMLAVLQSPPGWANGGRDQFYPPTDPADFARFAGAAARRYSARGLHHWEIWNEPNIPLWKPVPDPARYTTLLKAAYGAIHSADPEATVISGGLAPAPDDATHMDPTRFLQQMYDAGASGHFDAFGYHPYYYNSSAVTPFEAWPELLGRPSMRTIMEANGDGAKPVWGTEYGSPGWPEGISPTPAGGGRTEQGQADEFRVSMPAWESLPWAGPLFFYTLQDIAQQPLTSHLHWFGLVRADWTPKPALAVWSAAAKP